MLKRDRYKRNLRGFNHGGGADFSNTRSYETLSLSFSLSLSLDPSFSLSPSLQFRFATRLDILMIVVGTVMGIASGVALPSHFLLFGRVINQFVFYEQALLFRPMDQSPLNDSACEALRIDLRNRSMGPPDPMSTAAGDDSMFLCQQTSVFSNILNTVCDPEGVFIDEIDKFSLIYLGLATAVLLAVFIANVFWNISAYRQSRKMRMAFYRSILGQDIGWFDVNNTAELSTRLSE